jgi:hypothetical protein
MWINSKANTKEYSENYDRIFGKNKQKVEDAPLTVTPEEDEAFNTLALSAGANGTTTADPFQKVVNDLQRKVTGPDAY